eukprot:4032619-Ditylum_brightwellii.AAC.1
MKAFPWDSSSNLGEFIGHSKKVQSCDFRPKRPLSIVSGAEDQLTSLYSGPPFKLTTQNHDHTNFVNCCRYAPNGDMFVTVGSDRKGFLYDADTGEK